MAACAQNAGTLQIHAAADLRTDEELRAANWQCPGCQVRMVPAAVDPDRKYARVPYFRAEPEHDPGCFVEGALELVHPTRRLAPQRRDALAAMAPTALRLAALRPQRAGHQQPPGGHVVQQPPGGGPRAPGDPNREQVTGSLALVARHYALAPELRHLRLRIPGLTGGTYDECIKPLRNFTVAPPQAEYCVLHAPVAFAAAMHVEEHAFEVPLHRGRWVARAGNERSGYDPRYRVRFDAALWPGRQVIALRQSAEAWMAEQRDLRGEAAEVHLLFLGRQSPDDPTLFVVGDWRLACFQTMLR